MGTKDELEHSFIESGEKARLKELLSQRLKESGWLTEVQSKCRAIIKEKGIENVTSEDLIAEVTPHARKAVPESVKRELLQHIRSFLQQQTGLSDL
uniref:Transcription and mRNA export factor ENY2 n=1 Tax=Plectus sambesii TaxID=2011161 RepID=A0A914VSF5_9BILA